MNTMKCALNFQNNEKSCGILKTKKNLLHQIEISFVVMRMKNGCVNSSDALERVSALNVTDEKNMCIDAERHEAEV